MTRLTVGQNSHLDIETISALWWQVISVHRVAGVKVGDMVRKTTRGYEVFRNLDDKYPNVVLPNRCTLTDEEE